jgi:hypothetical protein
MFGWKDGERTPAEACALLRGGKAPDRLRVRGRLDLANSLWLNYLPRELEAEAVNLANCTQLRGLPERLQCENLVLRGTRLRAITSGVRATKLIDARNCRELESIAPQRVTRLDLRGCTALANLPEGLEARWLEIIGCRMVTSLPTSLVVKVEHLDLSDCTGMAALPDGFKRLLDLNVAGCVNLKSLPAGIRIRSSVDVADSGLRFLPWSLISVRILWRGVHVSDRIAFEPDEITVGEILGEANLTRRRILLDRVGIEWFVDQVDTKVVDQDCDAGGERRLLRIAFTGGEDLVCLDVRCPSTGSRYVLRVPPRMGTCVEAAAWIAGYSDPVRYRPAVET